MPERQKSSVGLLLDGLKAPLRGVDFLLRHPTLMRYALAPFVLSLVLLLAMLFVTFEFLLIPIRDSIILKLHLATWLQWAFTLVLWPAALVAYTVLASFVFTALANLIAGPFNERLSERTEEMVTGKAESSVLTFRQAFGRLGKSFVMQLKKILFFVLLQVLILGTYLIPLFGPIVHAVLAAVVTIWFLASEFLDYPMERREISYRMRLYFAWTHRWEVLGFGIAVAFWLAVPVLGFTALPVSVVGGTLLYLAAIES